MNWQKWVWDALTYNPAYAWYKNVKNLNTRRKMPRSLAMFFAGLAGAAGGITLFITNEVFFNYMGQIGAAVFASNDISVPASIAGGIMAVWTGAAALMITTKTASQLIVRQLTASRIKEAIEHLSKIDKLNESEKKMFEQLVQDPPSNSLYIWDISQRTRMQTAISRPKIKNQLRPPHNETYENDTDGNFIIAQWLKALLSIQLSGEAGDFGHKKALKYAYERAFSSSSPSFIGLLQLEAERNFLDEWSVPPSQPQPPGTQSSAPSTDTGLVIQTSGAAAPPLPPGTGTNIRPPKAPSPSQLRVKALRKQLSSCRLGLVADEGAPAESKQAARQGMRSP